MWGGGDDDVVSGGRREEERGEGGVRVEVAGCECPRGGGVDWGGEGFEEGGYGGEFGRGVGLEEGRELGDGVDGCVRF